MKAHIHFILLALSPLHTVLGHTIAQLGVSCDLAATTTGSMGLKGMISQSQMLLLRL